jgi:hypothetical protein
MMRMPGAVAPVLGFGLHILSDPVGPLTHVIQAFQQGVESSCIPLFLAAIENR